MSMPSTPPPVPPVAPVDVRTNHLLHFLMGFPTCGGWWIIWPFVWFGNQQANAGRRRAYQQAVVQYQQALWAREAEQVVPGEPRYGGGPPGHGDPLAGYRPAPPWSGTPPAADRPPPPREWAPRSQHDQLQPLPPPVRPPVGRDES